MSEQHAGRCLAMSGRVHGKHETPAKCCMEWHAQRTSSAHLKQVHSPQDGEPSKLGGIPNFKFSHCVASVPAARGVQAGQKCCHACLWPQPGMACRSVHSLQLVLVARVLKPGCMCMKTRIQAAVIWMRITIQPAQSALSDAWCYGSSGSPAQVQVWLPGQLQGLHLSCAAVALRTHPRFSKDRVAAWPSLRFLHPCRLNAGCRGGQSPW